MMKPSKFIFFKIILCASVLFGCATHRGLHFKYGLSYEQVEAIPLKSKSDVLIRAFGKPDRIDQVGKHDQQVTWVYFVKGHKWIRAAFWINTQDDTMIGKSFEFMDEDQAKLSNFNARSPGVKFNIERAKQIGHAISRVLNYSNDTLGLYLVVNEGRQEVESVSWLVPKNSKSINTSETN